MLPKSEWYYAQNYKVRSKKQIFLDGSEIFIIMIRMTYNVHIFLDAGSASSQKGQERTWLDLFLKNSR